LTPAAIEKADPYASVSAPSLPSGISHASGSGCNQTGDKITGNKTANFLSGVSGGTYVFCNGLQVQGGSTANLCPGTYIIDQGTLDLKGGGVLNAPPTANTTPPMSSAICGTNTTVAAATRVLPRSFVEAPIGRPLRTTADPEQRPETVKRIKPPVESELVFVEIGL
jgi:hypothetical protein